MEYQQRTFMRCSCKSNNEEFIATECSAYRRKTCVLWQCFLLAIKANRDKVIVCIFL